MATAIVFIPLTQGKVAVIDFEDFELVRGFSWYASSGKSGGPIYARRTIPHPVRLGKQACIQMHTQITGWQSVDHRNGNGLDNRRCNLRPFGQVQNLRASISLRKHRSSKYRGVSWYEPSPHKWRAHITVNKKKTMLGYFDSEEGAARAWDAAAVERGFSEEALNFPPPRPDDYKVL